MKTYSFLFYNFSYPKKKIINTPKEETTMNNFYENISEKNIGSFLWKTLPKDWFHGVSSKKTENGVQIRLILPEIPKESIFVFLKNKKNLVIELKDIQNSENVYIPYVFYEDQKQEPTNNNKNYRAEFITEEPYVGVSAKLSNGMLYIELTKPVSPEERIDCTWLE